MLQPRLQRKNSPSTHDNTWVPRPSIRPCLAVNYRKFKPAGKFENTMSMLKPLRTRLHRGDDEQRDTRVSGRASVHREVLIRSEQLGYVTVEHVKLYLKRNYTDINNFTGRFFSVQGYPFPFSALLKKNEQKYWCI